MGAGLFLFLFMALMVPYAMGIWGYWPVAGVAALSFVQLAIAIVRGDRAPKWEPSPGRVFLQIALAVIFLTMIAWVFGRR